MMDKQNMMKQGQEQEEQGDKKHQMGMMMKEKGMQSMKGKKMGMKGRCPMCGKKMKNGEGPHRGKGPAHYSDDQVKQDVERLITDDSWLDASNLQVNVDEGIVTLTGNVDSWKSKRKAEDITLKVYGVKDVKNDLEIQDQES